MKQAEASLGGRLGDKTLEEREKKQAELFRRKKEVEANKLTEEVKRSKLSPDEYLRKRRELDMLKMEQRRFLEQKTASRVRVEESELSVDDRVNLEEELAALEEEKAYEERKQMVLTETMLGLQEAGEATIEGIQDTISSGISKYLARISGGKYSKLEVDSELGIKVYSEEKGDWVVPGEELSRGTVNQMYLIARLVIADIVSGDRFPPLLLDDPFITFDSVRSGETKRVLEEFAKNYQVLLFTCHDDYDSWGKLIELK